MKLRNAVFGLVVTLAQATGMAQANPSPIGTWNSEGMRGRDMTNTYIVQLVVSNVDAGQRASGRFQVFIPGGASAGSYGCHRARSRAASKPAD